MKVKILQRPVGQGGLCEGALETAETTTRWIYDCGSNQYDRLRSELNKVHRDLDLVFLSHLDDDHVNGLDYLIRSKDVVEVVLPYLEDHERLLILAQAAAQERLSSQFATFISDPVAWLRDRGVERITLLEGPGDSDGEAGPVPRLPPEAGTETKGPLLSDWSTPTGAVVTRQDGVARVPAGAIIQMTDAANRVADWVFLPFAHPPSKARVRAFKAELAVRFPGMAPSAIVQAAWTPDGRAELQACYDAIWSSDTNLVSMSLYAGPVSSSGMWRENVTLGSRHYRRRGDTSAAGWHHHRGDMCAAGWLSTGDAKLSGRDRPKAFSKFYADILDKVAVLIVPHHGAANSWDASILVGMTRLYVGCAAAGPNGYGHPHTLVSDDIDAHPGAVFWQVSDDISSILSLTAQV